jgi:pimeloyl-ACP methyl ester carboxylesterase
VRFVEITYPRTLTWTLEDYAAGIEAALKDNRIAAGWLLGESFGSQVMWSLVGRERFEVKGAILAGGFVRHPTPKTARIVGRVTAGIPFWLLRLSIGPYAAVLRWRFHRSPEVLQSIDEFLSRRTDLDRQAAAHRLRLLSQNDPSSIAAKAGPPVFALAGLWDPIVPWVGVRKWLRRNCRNLREYKIIARADHVVLGTAPEAAAKVILDWMAGVNLPIQGITRFKASVRARL